MSLVDCRVLEAFAMVVQHWRRVRDLRKLIKLETGGERIGQLDVLGEGGENDVTELNPAGGNEIAKRLVIQEQEVWEVVEKKNENLQQAAVEEVA